MIPKWFEHIKQGLNPSKNASLHHIITLIQVLRQHNYDKTMELFLSYRIPCLLIQYLDNLPVYRFMSELIISNNASDCASVVNTSHLLKHMINR